MDYYIVIPAHNEEKFIELTLNSLSAQTLQPKKVILVNDNSTDGTEALMDKYVAENCTYKKLNTTSSTKHMPGSKVINAFNKGLAMLDDSYDFIVKLDADLILPPTYFEEIAALFKEDPTVGIAGGFVFEENPKGHWKLNHPMNKDHVRGAFKAYSKACFNAIGGLKNAMGWDTVDELLARFHNFKIATKDSLHVKHLRPTGNAYNKQAKLLQGQAMYTMGYGFTITVIASLKMALKQKKLNAFFLNLQGYIRASQKNTPKLVSNTEAKFIKHYRWSAIKKKIITK